eukprot:TRINITY_DN5886_c0_g1_i1.p1 TRINITY_DN5886_c0_g1~~TRINITY_DN5886_c0_g1_i1.p1  ORF type:complete len:551 (-),score=120.96 TRINITY_DN5886_c0_g1_i1:518-2053(-)
MVQHSGGEAGIRLFERSLDSISSVRFARCIMSPTQEPWMDAWALSRALALENTSVRVAALRARLLAFAQVHASSVGAEGTIVCEDRPFHPRKRRAERRDSYFPLAKRHSSMLPASAPFGWLSTTEEEEGEGGDEHVEDELQDATKEESKEEVDVDDEESGDCETDESENEVFLPNRRLSFGSGCSNEARRLKPLGATPRFKTRVALVRWASKALAEAGIALPSMTVPSDQVCGGCEETKAERFSEPPSPSHATTQLTVPSQWPNEANTDVRPCGGGAVRDEFQVKAKPETLGEEQKEHPSFESQSLMSTPLLARHHRLQTRANDERGHASDRDRLRLLVSTKKEKQDKKGWIRKGAKDTKADAEAKKEAKEEQVDQAKVRGSDDKTTTLTSLSMQSLASSPASSPPASLNVTTTGIRGRCSKPASLLKVEIKTAHKEEETEEDPADATLPVLAAIQGVPSVPSAATSVVQLYSSRPTIVTSCMIKQSNVARSRKATSNDVTRLRGHSCILG